MTVAAARPASEPGAGVPAVRLRPARASDVPALHALATQVFLDTYATSGVSSALAHEAMAQFACAAFEASLADPLRRLLVAERDRHLLGYAEVVAGASQALVPDLASAELNRLYVQRPFLRGGLGTRLLRGAERLAAGCGATTLWLTVWVGNVGARDFYTARGYADLGATGYSFGGRTFENRVCARRLGGPA